MVVKFGIPECNNWIGKVWMSLHIISSEDKQPLSFMPQLVLVVGRIEPSGVKLLGTSFAVARGKFATTKHVTNGDDSNLVVVLPRYQTLLEYQDTSDKTIRCAEVKTAAIDPFKDICILSTNDEDVQNSLYLLYRLGGTDDVVPGSPVATFSFPHADHNRLVLTQHDTNVGARVLIEAGGIKSKHIILNTQARPGQSGGPVINLEDMSVVGMIIGAYTPGSGETMFFGGVDTRTLHQTTHVISAEYLKEMI
jgi:S1-C subfamily serine protease